jgi:hypothetical protein
MIADRTDVLNILVSGGDDRLTLDPRSGLNMYGYGAAPQPDDLTFNSSTASTISARGFAAVCETFDRLHPEVATGNCTAIYVRETDLVRDRLRSALGIGRGEADIVLAASGTDLHLIVASLLRGLHDRPVLTVSLTGSETGSGVGLAASGRHAMPHPVSRRLVTKGEPLASEVGLTSFAVHVRDESGDLRPDADIAEDLLQAIHTAIAAGQHCVLVATDVSKTGLIAPDLETVFTLKTRFGDRLDILVDACQLRVAPETIQAYLARGCLVAVTGSKFVAGPIFSGALIIPSALAADLKTASVGSGLGDYSGSGDWPEDWQAAKCLPNRRNFGLLLRWQAALVELEALLAYHPLKIGWVSMTFANAVQSRLRIDTRFEAVAGRQLERSVLGVPGSYDLTPTIFPFLLRRCGSLVSANEMTSVYQQLAAGSPGTPRVRLGQPVALGQRNGQPVAALRLCLSAPLLTNACESELALDRLIADAMLALDCAADMAEGRISRIA